MAQLAMFPLGMVLFPGALLPLHVFEPRYRQLTDDVLAGDREFGVTLIERGSEVGGGDLRTLAGTVARVEHAERFDDGRWALMCVGDRRIRVDRWFDDAPYPQAEVTEWPDGPSTVADGDYQTLVGLLRRTLALKTEIGEPAVPATVDLDDDPAAGSYQVAAFSPLGPSDRQRVLVAETAADRIALLRALLVDELELLTARIGMDPPGDLGHPSQGEA